MPLNPRIALRKPRSEQNPRNIYLPPLSVLFMCLFMMLFLSQSSHIKKLSKSNACNIVCCNSVQKCFTIVSHSIICNYIGVRYQDWISRGQIFLSVWPWQTSFSIPLRGLVAVLNFMYCRWFCRNIILDELVL